MDRRPEFKPRLRSENAVIAVLALLAYLQLGAGWGSFALLILAIGYGLKSRDDHRETHLGRLGGPGSA